MITDIVLNKVKKDEPLVARDKISRSLLKSISWRIVGTIDTFIISYIITGQIKFALSIGLIELLTKMFLFFMHERLWNQIKWGKK
ncbi:MAG: DUF2061 domain-containing protein [Flavobacteriaceae bacterium]